MAIDVLSRRSATPILVGDAEDVQAYRRCYIDESTVPAHLVLSAADEVASVTLRFQMSAACAANISGGESILLVALTKADDIASAILVPLNDAVSPARSVEEPEIKRLAEELVSGDFTLDFLR